MLYYFWKELKELPSKSQETSSAKSRNFPREIKAILKPSQETSRRKSNQSKKEIQSIPNPIPISSPVKNLYFAGEVSWFRFGESFVLQSDNDSFGSKKSA